MSSESAFINEAQKQLGHKTASFVNIVFFRSEDLDEYTGSVLPFQTEGDISYDTAFKFQETIRQVVKIQEAKGMNFQDRKIGIVVADHNLFNAEMIADAVLGVFRLASAEVIFALATDREKWYNTVTREQGEVAAP